MKLLVLAILCVFLLGILGTAFAEEPQQKPSDGGLIPGSEYENPAPQDDDTTSSQKAQNYGHLGSQDEG